MPKQYKFMLEVLPNFLLIAIYVSFFVGFFVLGVLVGAFGPDTYETLEKDVPFENPVQDLIETLGGNDTVQVRLDDVDRFNGEIFFWMKLYPNQKLSSVAGFEQLLQLDVNIWGSGDVNAKDDDSGDLNVPEEFVRLTPSTNIIKRVLKCNQNSIQCEPVLLFHEPFVQYRVYLVNVRIMNQEMQATKGLYNSQLTFGFTFGTTKFAVFELIYRYLFVFSAVVLLVGFILITRLMQPFSYWHTEQRWIVLLLTCLILFNNPLYIFHFLSTNWIFTFLNVIFKVTFVTMIMLSLLIFTHSMFTKQQERNFLTFYLPKFILIGCIWGASLITFTYATVRRNNNPSFILTEVDWYIYIVAISYLLLAAYAFWLFYYVTKAIGMMHLIPQKYTNKFKAVWGMTVIVLIISIIVFSVLTATGYFTSSIFFLSFHVLFNFYTYLLTILFLPSYVSDTISRQDLEEEGMLSAE